MEGSEKIAVIFLNNLVSWLMCVEFEISCNLSHVILDFHIMVTSNHLPVRYAQDTHCVNISCPSGLLLAGSYVFISYSYEYNQPFKKSLFFIHWLWHGLSDFLGPKNHWRCELRLRRSGEIWCSCAPACPPCCRWPSVPGRASESPGSLSNSRLIRMAAWPASPMIIYDKVLRISWYTETLLIRWCSNYTKLRTWQL